MERLVIVGLFALLVGVLRLALPVWSRRTARHLRLDAEGASRWDGRPQLVYFWSEECRQCRVQGAAVRRLEAELGDAVVVRWINALREPELAAHYGVLTLPTTVVIDGHGQVVAVNHGYAYDAKLREQLDRAIASSASIPAGPGSHLGAFVVRHATE